MQGCWALQHVRDCMDLLRVYTTMHQLCKHLAVDFKPTSNNNNRNIYSAIMSVSANPSKVLQMSERASSEVVCDFKKKEKDVHI